MSNLKIIPLGGLGEIGKNMTVFETKNEIIIVDCGIAFPSIEILGIDVLIPDFEYLRKKKDKVKGIIVTHGHEDHVGAVAYLLKEINVPVYSTRLALEILAGKAKERNIKTIDARCVKAGDVVNFDVFSVEFIHVNHSIPDAVALAIKTPIGNIIHTGDFKIDLTPCQGKPIDLIRFAEYGREGVRLLMCESTNIESDGRTESERIVKTRLEELFAKYEGRRIIIGTFSSNLQRIQNIINSSAKHNRNVAILGRSMSSIVDIGLKSEYLKDDNKVIIGKKDARVDNAATTIIATGSQGEPASVLSRIAYEENSPITLHPDDVIILSSNAIPGNEKSINEMINRFVEKGIEVVYGREQKVHVSGHARKDDISIIHALTKPKLFMPIHGEAKQLLAHKNLAKTLGMDEKNIFVMQNGNILEITKNTAKILKEKINIDPVFVEGTSVADIDENVLRDRQILSNDGVVVVSMGISRKTEKVVNGPEVINRGFANTTPDDDLFSNVKSIAKRIAVEGLYAKDTWGTMRSNIRSVVSKTIFKATGKNPIVIVILSNCPTIRDNSTFEAQNTFSVSAEGKDSKTEQKAEKKIIPIESNIDNEIDFFDSLIELNAQKRNKK